MLFKNLIFWTSCLLYEDTQSYLVRSYHLINQLVEFRKAGNEQKSFVLGVIPAGGGSKEVPRKNIKYLDGKPLIEYSITVARNKVDCYSFLLSKITSSQKIMAILKTIRCICAFYLNNAFSNSLALAVDTMIHAVSEYENLNKGLKS